MSTFGWAKSTSWCMFSPAWWLARRDVSGFFHKEEQNRMSLSLPVPISNRLSFSSACPLKFDFSSKNEVLLTSVVTCDDNLVTKIKSPQETTTSSSASLVFLMNSITYVLALTISRSPFLHFEHPSIGFPTSAIENWFFSYKQKTHRRN